MDRGLGRLDTFLEDSTSFLSVEEVGLWVWKKKKQKDQSKKGIVYGYSQQLGLQDSLTCNSQFYK